MVDVRPPERHHGGVESLAAQGKRESMNLEDALARWARANVKSGHTLIRYAQALRSLRRFGIARSEEATRERVAEYVQFRLIFVAPVSINVDVAALATVLGFLRKTTGEPHRERLRLQLVDVREQAIPVKKPKRLAAPHRTRDEVAHLATVARQRDPQVELPLRVCALAGLRIRELVRVRWADIDLGARPALSVRLCPELGLEGRIKGGCERRVPICGELRTLLVERRAELGRDFLFLPRLDVTGKSWGRAFVSPHTLRVALSRVVKASEVRERVSWSILRHTRASWWVQAGVPIAKVALWLGHTVEICERYYAGLVEGYDPDCERVSA